MEICEFAGWERCLKISNAQAELIVTLDVGPRIMSYRLLDGENVLKIIEEQAGTKGGEEFLVRGGHRFWLAPETKRTYTPDNLPVAEDRVSDHTVTVSNPAVAPWGIRKDVSISLAAEGAAVTLDHRATNDGAAPAELAPWALTVMRAGGVEIIPQPPLGEHPRDLLPNRLLVPWPYADLANERLCLGRRFITLRQDARGLPFKLGLAHRERWAAYLLPRALFVKTFSYHDGAVYPDLGCNFETFTDGAFLEVETLGPLQTLAPGETCTHSECWHLFATTGTPDVQDQAALAQWLTPYLSQLTYF